MAVRMLMLHTPRQQRTGAKASKTITKQTRLARACCPPQMVGKEQRARPSPSEPAKWLTRSLASCYRFGVVNRVRERTSSSSNESPGRLVALGGRPTHA